ncbi:MAG TPA: AraC family transcriptional regulator [Ferruginibacter sp.]|nr:AraC family transcriptional regulator [Ferruginibacter sp.]
MNQLFKIFIVDEAEATKISASPDEPHKHDFEELIIGIDGQLEHFIDFKNTNIEAPLISFVTKGKVHRVIPKLHNGKCEMWAIRFKSEFIPETIFQLYSLFHDHSTIKMQEGECFERLVTVCKLMSAEMQQVTPDLAVVRHLLSALFTMIESERRKTEASDNGMTKSNNTTFKNFLKILEENYHRPENVEFYAEKLFMSARNLNTICQQVMEKSVTEIIELRKLIEAKNLLTYTDKTISEIGFELGYNEKAYFTNVFKKRTGHTPGEFREDMRKLVS